MQIIGRYIILLEVIIRQFLVLIGQIFETDYWATCYTAIQIKSSTIEDEKEDVNYVRIS